MFASLLFFLPAVPALRGPFSIFSTNFYVSAYLGVDGEMFD